MGRKCIQSRQYEIKIHSCDDINKQLIKLKSKYIKLRPHKHDGVESV